MKIEIENRVGEYITQWKKHAHEHRPQYERIGSDLRLADAFSRLRQRIRILSAEDGVEPEYFCERFKILHEFLDDLGYALNPDIHRLMENERVYKEKVRAGEKQPVWFHRNTANMYWLMEVQI